MGKIFWLDAAKVLLGSAFACALFGIFVFGNYLMIEDHRPAYELASSGFVYPIPGKGGYVYVTKVDLIILAGLSAVAIISAVVQTGSIRELMKDHFTSCRRACCT